MQNAKNLALCIAIAIGAYLVGRSTLDAQQPVPTLDRQFTPGTVYADARTPISSLPFTIDRCGSYFLTACLTGSAGQHGVAIAADDVTVDMNGFSLIGVPGSLSGIKIDGSQPYSNVRVHNGSLIRWDESGVEATTAGSIELDGLTVIESRGTGVRLPGTGGRILGSVVRRSGAGIEGGDVISHCEANSNTGIGIIASDGALVNECQASTNGSDGIVANSSLISRCIASGNGGDDFALVDSSTFDCHPPQNEDVNGPYEVLIYNVEGSNAVAVEIIPGRVHVHSVYSIKSHALFFDGPGTATNSGTIRFVSGEGVAFASSYYLDGVGGSGQVLDIVVENGLYLSKFEYSGTTTDYVIVTYKQL